MNSLIVRQKAPYKTSVRALFHTSVINKHKIYKRTINYASKQNKSTLVSKAENKAANRAHK